MANTTNFGWETPDDTDLVKDGAAAMRTLGNAIDTSFVDLKGGTTGQLLSKASNTDLDYSWVAAPAAGKVLQVITATTSTSATSTSSTYADTNLTATITPTAATSKILILIEQYTMAKRSQEEAYTGIRLLRNATDILTNARALAYRTGTQNANMTEFSQNLPIMFLDSPSTTSAITYKTQFNAGITANSGAAGVQSYSQTSTITLIEIGA